MGFEDEVEQSKGRPCRLTNGWSKRTHELTSSIVPRGTSFHRSVELEFPPIAFNPARFSCCCGTVRSATRMTPFVTARAPRRRRRYGARLPTVLRPASHPQTSLDH